jgi:hypothetical protein
MLQLIYVSEALAPFSAVALRELLVKAREKNTPLGVSGFLLHKQGSFLQVLEGDAPVVEALIGRIGKDPRHRHVLILLRSEIAERNFGDWSMGFADASGHAPLPGFRANHALADLAGDAAAVRTIVKSFSDGRWRRLLM